MEEVITAKSGVKFTLVEIEPYIKKDGSETMLKVWEARCKRCNDLFKMKTPIWNTKEKHNSGFGFIHCLEHRL
jgi:hypothetical protein